MTQTTDPEVAAILATVRDFAQDHTLTTAEAAAVRAAFCRPNKPLLVVKSLPSRKASVTRAEATFVEETFE